MGGVGKVENSNMLPLTAFWHHALLHFEQLGFAKVAICTRPLHLALPRLHANAAGGAAGVPLGPLGNQATAGRCGGRRRRGQV